MKKTIPILLLLIALSCSKDEETTPKNSNLGLLKLESISFQGQEVTIDWNDVVDADDDILYYNIYINAILVAETTKSINTSHIEYNNEYDCRIIATDKNDGTLNWSFDAGLFNNFYASPTIYKNTIIAATSSVLYAFDKETSDVKWSYYRSNGGIESSPFIYDNKVYIGFSNNGSGELVCLNVDNGNVIWKYDLPNKTTTSPIVFEDTVYIGDWGKNFYAINANTGTLKWKSQTKEFITKSPSIVIGNSDTVIYPSSHGLKN